VSAGPHPPVSGSPGLVAAPVTGPSENVIKEAAAEIGREKRNQDLAEKKRKGRGKRIRIRILKRRSQKRKTCPALLR